MASLFINPITVGEGDGFADVVVRLDAAAAGTVTVIYDTANSTAGGNDYVYPTGTLTFQPGELTKTVRVELRNDTDAEPAEIFFFTLRNATGASIATAAAPVTIIDNDTVVALPRVFVDDVVVDEKQGQALFIVRLGQWQGEAANAAVSVRYATRDGSAIAGQDYTATSGMLTFAPGESVKTVAVALLDDGAAELAERFELLLDNPVNASIARGTALAQIALSDGTGSSQPRISAGAVTVGESGGFVDIPVQLHAPSTLPVTVVYDTSNSTAGGNDYVYPTGTLTFQPGETVKSVRVQLRNDSEAEAPELFFFTLRNATNATIETPAVPITLIDNDTVVDAPRLFVDDIVVDEKQGTAQFVVRMGNSFGEAANGLVSVGFATRDGNALAGQDYVARSGTLTFQPGEVTQTVVVDLIDDAVAEGMERFELVLDSPANASIARGTALAQIALSDGTGSSQPRISVGAVTVSEGDGFLDLPVLLHAPSALPVTVVYDTSNSTAGGNDYVYPTGTLTFLPGETAKSVRVQLRDDSDAEAPELFYFTLRNATNATIETPAVPITLIDNDTVVETPKLFVDDILIDEKQGTAQFVVRLGRTLGEAANGVVSVGYATRDVSTVAGQDYMARSGTLFFQPGEVAQTVVVDLIDDAAAEGLERFELVLDNPINASLGRGTALAQIALSDGTGSSQPRISVRAVTVSEGDGFLDLPVLLHAPSALPVTLVYDTSNSTAGGNDYVYPTGTLTFLPGETAKSVRIQLRDDTEAEEAEVFYFTLRGATNATIQTPAVPVTIVDNDTVVETPSLLVEDTVVDEKQGTAQFIVRLGQKWGEPANGLVTVGFTTRDGTALAGQDYVARSGTLTFQPGESTATVVIDLIDDTLAEPGERFSLLLSNPVNARLGDATGVAEIGLSDGVGSSQPRISVTPVLVGEGDRFVEMPVRLHAPSSLPVTVVYDTSNASAGGNDYVYPTGTLSFAPGETVKTVRVQLRDDGTAEGSEVFNFTLRSATNASIATASVAVTLVDDDDAPRPLLSQGRSDDVYVVDTTAVDFIEATDGGFDVVRSSVSFALPAVLEGVILTGNALNATGHDGANFFMGNAANNSFDGRGGIDTVAYPGRDTDYAISGGTASRTVARNGEGTDTLLSIERLQFTSVVQAFDTSPGGNTWGAFALLNAAFDQFPDATALGQWTSMLDRSGGDLNELARQMIQYYAPGVDNESLVLHLWSTVAEAPISPADLAAFVGLIDSGSYTQASLTVLAAMHPFNTDEFVALVGQPMLLDSSWFPLPGA